MCDTIVSVNKALGGAVWFGKNSDREPGEAQVVEHNPARSYTAPATLRCTYLEIPQASKTNEIVISRPFWMWGAEMGANEHGVAIGNEAVFTRLPVPETGLTGMDLLRIALERTTSAVEALDLIIEMIEKFGQGGLCGYRHKGFRYHNSFIIADPTDAWVLETAGIFWAAERVTGNRTISNVLTIGRNFDRIAPGAEDHALKEDWCKAKGDFDFAASFGSPFFRITSGGEVRRACTLDRLNRSSGSVTDMIDALRDHNGLDPASGWRMSMPCAHASWPATRQSGQTTGSMVSRLEKGQTIHWLTGTSSPCLSVFKPVLLAGQAVATGPAPGEWSDRESLFWRHEAIHRAVLKNYEPLKAAFNAEREELEARALDVSLSGHKAAKRSEVWEEHRERLPEWLARVRVAGGPDKRSPMMKRFWANQNNLDRIAT